jgi:hypothetical protein
MRGEMKVRMRMRGESLRVCEREGSACVRSSAYDVAHQMMSPNSTATMSVMRMTFLQYRLQNMRLVACADCWNLVESTSSVSLFCSMSSSC